MREVRISRRICDCLGSNRKLKAFDPNPAIESLMLGAHGTDADRELLNVGRRDRQVLNADF